VIDGRRVIFDFQNDTLTVTDSRGASESPRWLSADQALVRASGAHGRLTAVNCRVDGVHAHAFIDSGAQASIANTQLFARLEEMGKTYIGDFVIPIVGVTGGEAHGRLTRVSSIQLGTLNFTNSTLVISDLPVFDVWGLADRPAILIGMNFLRKTSSLSIDYGSKELLIKVANVGIARAI
jgi:predicted aspartyl protease